MTTLKHFLREEEGVTAIEYGLIAALIAVLLIATLTDVKDGLVAVFGKVADELNKAAP